ncbi:MAG: hypothetical protein WC451_05270 [Patescibacteria group bacterium]
MANYSAKLDPDIKLFRDLVQSGLSPAKAYIRVYAIGRNITPQSAHDGGKRKMKIISLLSPQKGLISQSHQPVKKISTQPVENKEVAGSKEGLIKRLWNTVCSGENSEATAAARQLMEWYEKIEEKAEQKALDPAQLCAHLARFSRNKPPPDYLPHVISALNMLLHPSRDEWIAALKIGQDRAETTLTPHQEPVTAPLPTQIPVNTDNNGGSPALPQ